MIMDFKTKTICSSSQDGYHAKASKLFDMAGTMNADELQLLVEVYLLIANRPDRREFAMSWTGRMKDLPAALARI